MIRIGTVEEAVCGGRRRVFDAATGRFRGHTDFLFESEEGDVLGPQAFLVHQAPGWTLAPHFHLQHQVQVVVGGAGHLGKHPVGPGSVHYASPQAPYGPLVAGPDGLDYFTLRVQTDRGAWYMPESRPMMTPGLDKKQATASTDARLPAVDTLIAPRPDGLGEDIALPQPLASPAEDTDALSVGGGRFHVVLGGSFEIADHSLPRHACMHAGPAEWPRRARALAPDSQLVVVQFPALALGHHVSAALRHAAMRQPFTVAVPAS
jgi:hypothetical protein